MADEPIDPSLGVSPSQGPWAPGGDPWSQSNNRMGNGTSGADGDQSFFLLDTIISLLMALVCLCGATGNGAVVWLQGFHLKRRCFSFYICSLAWVDGIFLLFSGIQYIRLLLQLEFIVWGSLWALLQLIRLGLMVVGSTERCISGPGPLRHPRLSLDCYSLVIVFLLISGLAVCLWVSESVCDSVDAPCGGLGWVYVVTVVVTLLVLCVSSLTLLICIQCGSRGTRPSRLDVSILLTVLAFLLLGLPYNVFFLVLTIVPDNEYVSALWETLGLLSALNSVVNPLIYFLVGRYRRRPGKMPLQEVLQRALSDDNEEGLNSRAPHSPQTPELREGGCLIELDRTPSRAAAQEAASPAVSPQGPCEEEAAPVLTH